MTNIPRLKEVVKELRCPNAGESKYNYVGALITFVSIIRPKSLLEIGSFDGVSTEVFCNFCSKVVAVDPFCDPETFRNFTNRMEPYADILELHIGYSPEALYQFPSDSFEMCYIDGNHTTEQVRKDIRECKRVVAPNGYLAGHDYGLIPDVTAAVILEVGREPDILLPDGTWVAINASGI